VAFVRGVGCKNAGALKVDDVSKDKVGAVVAFTVGGSLGGCFAAPRGSTDFVSDEGAPHWKSGAVLALVFSRLGSFLAAAKGEENGEVPKGELEVVPNPDLV
jgi:hypothetical protein